MTKFIMTKLPIKWMCVINLVFVGCVVADIPWFSKKSPYYAQRSMDPEYISQMKTMLEAVFDPAVFYNDVNGTCWCNRRPPFLYMDSIVSREIITRFKQPPQLPSQQYFNYMLLADSLDLFDLPPEDTSSFDYLMSYKYAGPAVVENWNCTLCGYPCDLRYNYSVYRNCPYCSNGVLNTCPLPKYYSFVLPPNCSNITMGLTGQNRTGWNGIVPRNSTNKLPLLPPMCLDSTTCGFSCETPQIISQQEGTDGGFMCFQGTSADFNPRNYTTNPISNPNNIWAKLKTPTHTCMNALHMSSADPLSTIQYYGTIMDTSKAKNQSHIRDALQYVNTHYYTQSNINDATVPNTVENLQSLFNPGQYFMNLFTWTPTSNESSFYDIDVCAMDEHIMTSLYTLLFMPASPLLVPECDCITTRTEAITTDIVCTVHEDCYATGGCDDTDCGKDCIGQYCAIHCMGKGCGQNCIGEDCAISCGCECEGCACHGAIQCGKGCNGIGCADGCNGVECGMGCQGYGCAATCSGNNCGMGCHGDLCAINCEGDGCGLNATDKDSPCNERTLAASCVSYDTNYNCTWDLFRAACYNTHNRSSSCSERTLTSSCVSSDSIYNCTWNRNTFKCYDTPLPPSPQPRPTSKTVAEYLLTCDLDEHTETCHAYCYMPWCGVYCNRNGCAASCTASGCGQNCIGISCAQNCTGDSCGKGCQGFECANKCNGTECAMSCHGKDCALACNGTNCDLYATDKYSRCIERKLETSCLSADTNSTINCTWGGHIGCYETIQSPPPPSTAFSLCPTLQYDEMYSCLVDTKGCPILNSLNASSCICSFEDLWCRDDITIALLLRESKPLTPMLPKCPLVKNNIVQARHAFFNLDADLNEFELSHPYFWATETSITTDSTFPLTRGNEILETYFPADIDKKFVCTVQDTLISTTQSSVPTTRSSESPLLDPSTHACSFKMTRPLADTMLWRTGDSYETTLSNAQCCENCYSSSNWDINPGNNENDLIRYWQNDCGSTSSTPTKTTAGVLCSDILGIGWWQYCPNEIVNGAAITDQVSDQNPNLNFVSQNTQYQYQYSTIELPTGGFTIPQQNIINLVNVQTNTNGLQSFFFLNIPNTQTEETRILKTQYGQCYSSIYLNNAPNTVNKYYQSIQCICSSQKCTDVLTLIDTDELFALFYPEVATVVQLVQSQFIIQTTGTVSAAGEPCPEPTYGSAPKCSITNAPIIKPMYESIIGIIKGIHDIVNQTTMVTGVEPILSVSTGCTIPKSFQNVSIDTTGVCQNTHKLYATAQCLQLGKVPCASLDSQNNCPRSTPNCQEGVTHKNQVRSLADCAKAAMLPISQVAIAECLDTGIIYCCKSDWSAITKWDPSYTPCNIITTTCAETEAHGTLSNNACPPDPLASLVNGKNPITSKADCAIANNITLADFDTLHPLFQCPENGLYYCGFYNNEPWKTSKYTPCDSYAKCTSVGWDANTIQNHACPSVKSNLIGEKKVVSSLSECLLASFATSESDVAFGTCPSTGDTYCFPGHSGDWTDISPTVWDPQYTKCNGVKQCPTLGLNTNLCPSVKQVQLPEKDVCTGGGPLCLEDSDCIGPGKQTCNPTNGGHCIQQCYADYGSRTATPALSNSYMRAVFNRLISNPGNTDVKTLFVSSDYICSQDFPNCIVDGVLTTTAGIGYCANNCTSNEDCEDGKYCIGTEIYSDYNPQQIQVTSPASCALANGQTVAEVTYDHCASINTHYCTNTGQTWDSSYQICALNIACPENPYKIMGSACPSTEDVTIYDGHCSTFVGPQYYVAHPTAQNTYEISFYYGSDCLIPAIECNGGDPYILKTWNYTTQEFPVFINSGHGLDCSNNQWTQVEQDVNLRPPTKSECETYGNFNGDFSCSFEPYMCQGVAIKRSTLNGIPISSISNKSLLFDTFFHTDVNLSETVEFYNMQRLPILLTELTGEDVLLNQNILTRLLWMRFYKVVEDWNTAYPNDKIYSGINESTPIEFWQFYTNFTQETKEHYYNNNYNGTCGFIMCGACLPTFRLNSSDMLLHMNTFTAPNSKTQFDSPQATPITLSEIDKASIFYDVIVGQENNCNENILLDSLTTKYGGPVYLQVKGMPCKEICSSNVKCDGLPGIGPNEFTERTSRSECTTIDSERICKETPGCMTCMNGGFTTSPPPTSYVPIQIYTGEAVYTYVKGRTSPTDARTIVGIITGGIVFGMCIFIVYRIFKNNHNK